MSAVVAGALLLAACLATDGPASPGPPSAPDEAPDPPPDLSTQDNPQPPVEPHVDPQDVYPPERVDPPVSPETTAGGLKHRAGLGWSIQGIEVQLFTHGLIDDDPLLNRIEDLAARPERVPRRKDLERAAQEIEDAGWAEEVRVDGRWEHDWLRYRLEVEDERFTVLRPPLAVNFSNGFRLAWRYYDSIFKSDHTLRFLNVEQLFRAMRPQQLWAEVHYRDLDDKVTEAAELYGEKRIGGSVTLQRRTSEGGFRMGLHGYFTTALRVRYDAVSIVPAAPKDWYEIGEPDIRFDSLPPDAPPEDRVLASSVMLDLDFRDSFILPTRGFFAELAVDAGADRSHQRPFVRAWIDLRAYAPVGKRHVFAGRYVRGVATASTPRAEEFQTGTPFYAQLAQYRTYFGRGIDAGLLGGTRLNSGSVEYRLAIRPWLHTGLFYDLGSIDGRFFDSFGGSVLLWDSLRIELGWDKSAVPEYWFEYRWLF